MSPDRRHGRHRLAAGRPSTTVAWTRPCLSRRSSYPFVFLVALVGTAKLVRQPGGGTGAWWFLAFTALGFTAAIAVAGGPALALRSLHPTEPTLRIAVVAATLAALTLVVAGAAGVADAIGLVLWATPDQGAHQPLLLAAYLPPVVAASVTPKDSSGIPLLRLAHLEWSCLLSASGTGCEFEPSVSIA